MILEFGQTFALGHLHAGLVLLGRHARAFAEKQELGGGRPNPHHHKRVFFKEPVGQLSFSTCVHTHPEVLRVVVQVVQSPHHRLAVLFPLPLAENDLLEVPHPADDGDVTQLLLG